MPRFEFEFFRITKDCSEGETVHCHVGEFESKAAAVKHGE
jgi:hypothetical protein